MKKIAIVAHDKMKPVLVRFLRERENWLWGRTLVATGLTADFVEQEQFKVTVEHLSAGKEGGYRELKSLVDNGEIELALFFRDPEIVQDYEQDVIAFAKSCNRENIPLATNPATAELVILGLIKKETAERIRDKQSGL
jgi:methylglyoxal synthase